MPPPAPVPVTRYALVALLGLGAVLVVVLLVRPFIFTFADARDDANYALLAASELDAGPVVVEVLLEERHGLAGEEPQGDRIRVRVAAAPLPPGREGYSVVNAWSPTNDCPISLGPDRLVDCAGDAWTYEGFPIEPADPMLPALPYEVRQGAIVVDFTTVMDR
jgi:hypothetical protein